MSFKIVQCEVRWIASIVYSGNELLPTRFEVIGEYEDKNKASSALLNKGCILDEYGFWKCGTYGYGKVERVLREL